jgi:enoyl-CoA hydratase
MVAGPGTKFGQPEINLGVIPGWGGSQRLTRAIGKAKAMDLVLTGRMMDGEEAERAGLVARLVEDEKVFDTAMEIAQTIASKSRPVAMVAKEVVDTAFETTLAQGLMFERRSFQALFSLEDQKEGMDAFANKREAQFQDR